MICLESLQGHLEGIFLMFQMYRTVFIPAAFLQGSCFVGFFYQFLHIVTFLCPSISWEPLNCFTSIYFLETSLILLWGLPQKILFTAPSCLLGAILKYFGSHCHHFMFLFFQRVAPSNHLKCFIDGFCITLTVNVL